MKSRIPAAMVLCMATLLLPACSSGGDDVAGPENTVEAIVLGSGTGRVVSDPPSIDCPDVECGPLDWTPGMTVNMTATPEAGSTFVGWTGDCTGTDPNDCSFVVQGHMSVTATFN